MIDYVLKIYSGIVEVYRLKNGKKILERKFEGIASYRNSLIYLKGKNCRVYFFNEI